MAVLTQEKDVGLHPKQLRCFLGIQTGMSVAELSEELGISESTVTQYNTKASTILKKFTPEIDKYRGWLYSMMPQVTSVFAHHLKQKSLKAAIAINDGLGVFSKHIEVSKTVVNASMAELVAQAKESGIDLSNIVEADYEVLDNDTAISNISDKVEKGEGSTPTSDDVPIYSKEKKVLSETGISKNPPVSGKFLKNITPEENFAGEGLSGLLPVEPPLYREEGCEANVYNRDNGMLLEDATNTPYNKKLQFGIREICRICDNFVDKHYVRGSRGSPRRVKNILAGPVVKKNPNPKPRPRRARRARKTYKKRSV